MLSNRLRPRLAVVDPELTYSCPRQVTADSGIDALTHAIESYMAVDNEEFPLPAGEHDIAIRLRDTARPEGFDYAAERRIALLPEQSFAIDFNLVAGGFIFN